MKHKSVPAIAAIVAIFVHAGCASGDFASAVNAAAVVGGTILMSKLPPAKQVTVAKYLHTGAAAVRTLDPAKPPTSAEFKQLIAQFVKSDATASTYADIAMLVSTLYNKLVVPKLGPNAQANMALLEKLASELEALAAPYLK